MQWGHSASLPETEPRMLSACTRRGIDTNPLSKTVARQVRRRAFRACTKHPCVLSGTIDPLGHHHHPAEAVHRAALIGVRWTVGLRCREVRCACSWGAALLFDRALCL